MSVASTARARRRTVRWAGAFLGATLLAAGAAVTAFHGLASGEPETGAVRASPADPYAIPCGTLRCDARQTYCETINTDVTELPSNYACRPLPAPCVSPSGPRADACRCFPGGTRGDYCSATETQDHDGVLAFRRTTIGGR